MKRSYAASGVILAIVLLVVVVVLFVDFDSPRLGLEVLQEARRITGVNLTAAEFRLNLVKGLIAEDLDASSRFPGGRYRVGIDRMLLDHRVLPILAGRIVVRRVVLDKPRIEVSTDRRRPTPIPPSRNLPEGGSSTEHDEIAARPGAFPLDLTLLVSDISLNEATIIFAGPQPNRADLFIEDLDIGLRELSLSRGALTLLHGLSATGDVRARRFAMEAASARDLKGSLVLDKGRVAIESLVFTTDSGTFASRITLDFNRIPVGYEMKLEGAALKLEHLAALGEGAGLGVGHLKLDVEGFGGSAKNIRAEGVLRLEQGRLPAHPVLVAVDEALGSKVMVDSRYEESQVRFRVREEQLIVDDFHLITERAVLDISGIVHRDGPVDLNLVIRRPDVSIFHVTGALDEPQIELSRTKHGR